MSSPPRLAPEDQDYVNEKTRRLMAVAALHRVRRLVDDYRPDNGPLGWQRRGTPSSPTRDQLPYQVRRIAGLAAMVKVQQLAREYRQARAVDRRLARRIAVVLMLLGAPATVGFLAVPSALRELLRLLS